MSEKFIVPSKSGTQHRETLQEKKCSFPGCKVKELMTGKGKYCTEHKKRKYRKVIDNGKAEKKLKEEEARSANQIIKHEYKESIVVKMNCKLCNAEFEVKIIPSIFVYPKFCPNHRNFFKRELFLKSNSSNY